MSTNFQIFEQNMIRVVYKKRIALRGKLDIIKKVFDIEVDYEFRLWNAARLNSWLTRLNNALSYREKLNRNEIYVLTKHFGLEGNGREKLDEIAEVLKCSRSTISRIEASAIKKLKELFEEEREKECLTSQEEVDEMVNQEFSKITKLTTVEGLINNRVTLKKSELSKIRLFDLPIEIDFVNLMEKFEVYTIQDLIDFYIKMGPNELVNTREIGEINFKRTLSILKKYIDVEQLNKKASKYNRFSKPKKPNL